VHIRLLVVGDRQPSWVDEAFDRYAGRLPPQWKFRLDSIPTARRPKKKPANDARETESQQILAKVDASEQVVVLDEQGQQLTSPGLAARLADWQADGRDLCFVIGGPDGVTSACRHRADFIWSLASLTLPHGLARVLCVEQLYRAWSLQSGHPYHRD
jgi:23S rRNA (pseudouridine1915-N3)-methyltransferase